MKLFFRMFLFFINIFLSVDEGVYIDSLERDLYGDFVSRIATLIWWLNSLLFVFCILSLLYLNKKIIVTTQILNISVYLIIFIQCFVIKCWINEDFDKLTLYFLSSLFIHTGLFYWERQK